MDFLGYLKEHSDIEPSVLTRIRETALSKKQTIYQFLYFSGDTEEFGIKYSALEKYMVEAAKAADRELIVVDSTAGFSSDATIFSKLTGGVTSATAVAHLSETIIPLYRKDTGERICLTVRPDDDELYKRLQQAYGKSSFKFAICSRKILTSFRDMFIEPLLISALASKVIEKPFSLGSISQTAKESDARQLYDRLLNVGLERRASDIHFIPGQSECRVVFRIDGVNHHYTNIPLDALERICNILKNDGQISVNDPKQPVDGKVRFSPTINGVVQDAVDLRISIIPTKAGSDLNVRYLTSKLYTFQELGMSPHIVEQYKKLLELPSGLVVQVGPTGSGKSTTLYAGLSYIHKSMRNIITIEDPVEILMDGISQININTDIENGLTFADALKACLRHDPDVVVVGELRDGATAFEAIRAANTGHLVLTSLHTNDSIGAFERLINMGIDPFSLGEVIAAVMGQRLMRRLCPHCKEEYVFKPTDSQRKFYMLPEEPEEFRLFRPTGCAECNNTGYFGRIAVNEILVVNRTLRDFVQRHAVRAKFEDYLRSQGFKTLYHDALDRVLSGVSSLEELNRFASDTIAFRG